MTKGEVWIVDIPETNGYEQQGTRPVVIVTELEANIAMIIPCTSNLKALRFPHVVEIQPTQENGLDVNSIALIFQLRAIDQKRLLRKIGIIDNNLIGTVDEVLKSMLGLG